MSNQGMSVGLTVFPKPLDAEERLRYLPDVRDLLFVSGIPTSFLRRRYQSDPSVSFVGLPGGGWMLRFGTTGSGNAVGVDLQNGAVIEVLDLPNSPNLFVNSSLRQFANTVIAVSSRYPYYDQDADLEEREAVAGDILGVIREIDPEAAVPDRFWSTFVDDMEIGDLSTQDISSY